ncbi:MAG: HAD family hydrolase [Chitinophagales bacterium]
MEGIKNIIFDLGGVILNIDNNRTEAAFTALGAKNFQQHFRHGFADAFFREHELGKISDQQFIASLKKMINQQLPDEVIVDAWNALLLDFPQERIKLLTDLGTRYRLFLFSNTNALHLSALRKIYENAFGKNEFDKLFEKTYYSHILQMRKPDEKSYRLIIEENNLDPAGTLFVDDAWINIEGANAVGLKVHFVKPGTSILDLDW